jgi:hypothetical protein
MLARRNFAVFMTTTVRSGSCAWKSLKNSWNPGSDGHQILIRTIETTIRMAG